MISHVPGAILLAVGVALAAGAGLSRADAGGGHDIPLIDDRALVSAPLAASLEQWWANPTSAVGRTAFRRISADRTNLEPLRRMRPGLPIARQYQVTILIAALMFPSELIQALADTRYDDVELQIMVRDLLGRAEPDARVDGSLPAQAPAAPWPGVATEAIVAAAVHLASNCDWRVQVCAGELFEAAGGNAVHPALERLLAADQWPVRMSAIAALGMVTPEVAAPRIREAYAKSDDCRLDDRQALVGAMGRAGLWTELIERLGDDDPAVQVAAAHALAQAPELPAAIRHIIPKLARKPGDERARRELQQLVRRLNDEARSE